MPLGMEVGLDPGDIVLDGDPSPLKKGEGDSSPHFSDYVLWPSGWPDQDATWYGGRPQPRPHCVRWGPSSPKGPQPPILGPYLLWPNGRPSQLLLSTCEHSVASTLKCIINPALQTVANSSFLRGPVATLERRSQPSFSQSSKMRKKN